MDVIPFDATPQVRISLQRIGLGQRPRLYGGKRHGKTAALHPEMNHAGVPGVEAEIIEELTSRGEVIRPPGIERLRADPAEQTVVPEEVIAQHLAAAEAHRARIHAERAYELRVRVSGVLHVRRGARTVEPVRPQLEDELHELWLE